MPFRPVDVGLPRCCQAGYADRRIDRRPHDRRIAGSTLLIMSLAHSPSPQAVRHPVAGLGVELIEPVCPEELRCD
jgi:hypothetical protein